MNPIFLKSVIVSFAGHLAVMGLFSVSLGNKVQDNQYSSIYFLGGFLRNSSEYYQQPLAYHFNLRDLPGPLIKKTDGFVKENLVLDMKPSSTAFFIKGKKSFKERPLEALPLNRKESSILFHPLLPYGFNLYFKDRQVAHVELSVNVVREKKRNTTLIKRKISSGNLEVDLLTARYISHYFFIQHSKFPANEWQTVKIDLSAN